MAQASAQSLALDGKKRRGLNQYLGALILAVLLPWFAAAAYAVVQVGATFRNASGARLADTAQTLARSIESELRNTALMLSTIAAVSGDDDGRPALTEAQVARADLQLGARLVEETAPPRSAVTPSSAFSANGVPLEVIRRAFGTGKPAVSNLFTVGEAEEPRIAIVAPRSRAGGDRFIGLVVSPERLMRGRQQQRGVAASNILVAVADGTGRIVARSREAEQYVGKQANTWSALQSLGTSSGVIRSTTPGGLHVVFAFETLRGTPGWVTIVGEPEADFDARWRTPLLGLAIAALTAMGIALLAAALIGRHILRPVRTVAERARRLANGDAGEVIEIPPSSISEFETLRQSMDEADRALRSRADAEARIAAQLTASERRYRALADAGALVFWRRDQSGALIAATGWQDLTGQSDEQASGFGWIAHVCPEDRALVETVWARAIAGEAALDTEFRIKDINGEWRWVRGRGTLVPGAGGEPAEWIGVLEDVDARRRAQARIVHMAHHDALTGLGNRLLFQQRLREAIAVPSRRGKGAVLCLDLDRFKAVNDTLGHPIGDALLCALTERLRGCVRSEDHIARLGGDEFAIIQRDANQPAGASSLASRIVAALSEPYEISGHHIVIGVSIGVALLDGAGDADAVLKNADLALYRAKEEGRGRFCFFEPAMNARMQERHRLETDMRRAFAEGQFDIHYQPLVNLRTRKLTGFEALLRWNHPERGVMQPVEFIAAAEETGMIGPLGEWVLESACAEASRWPTDLRIAVNVSPGQLTNRAFVDAVAAILQRTGLPPSRLELEITENALIADIERAMASLLRLKVIGCSIVMDDFGTGASSIGYLRAFPFNKVKIDRSFVQELGAHKESDAIIRAVTGLCDSLGITSTAEGVETEAQLALLNNEACIEAQGYLFGRPLPAADIPALLQTMTGESVPRATQLRLASSQ